MLKVGTKAPDFTLDGCRGRRVTLSERKTAYTVLVFYPKNNTPG
jgi:peroxiredoxin